MGNLHQRIRRLQQRLLDVRLGPGAAKLSPSVQRIHLIFAKKYNDGHMGPRKFWHENLPRLQYHNPAVSMTVERTDDQHGPANLTIYFKGNSKDPTKQPSSENTETIDMKGQTSSSILDELLKITEGKQIEATQEEQDQLEEFEEQARRSEKDRRGMAKVLAAKRSEAAFLAQARKSVAAQSAQA